MIFGLRPYGVGSYGIGVFGDAAPIAQEAPPPFDPAATLISQYANSPVLLALIANFTAYLDPTANFQVFYDLVRNVATARGYGLDVWGRIVGVARALHVSTGQWFGFGEAGDALPFERGVFYDGQTVTSNYLLSDDAYRRLIYAKALTNISNGSIPALNQILVNLFPQYANAYVIDGQDMTMAYSFRGNLSPVDLAIIVQSGALAKPAGVLATVVQR